MEIYVGIAISLIGVISMVCKQTLMGLLAGVYLLFIGMSVTLVLLGWGNDNWVSAHTVSILMIFSGVLSVIAGMAAVIRLFYLKRNSAVLGLNELKH